VFNNNKQSYKSKQSSQTNYWNDDEDFHVKKQINFNQVQGEDRSQNAQSQEIPKYYLSKRDGGGTIPDHRFFELISFLKSQFILNFSFQFWEMIYYYCPNNSIINTISYI
jgi:hypothetical protein